MDGFFSDSLNKGLMSTFDLKPALYIDIDVDLHSSTLDVFNFLIPNNLLISGSLVYFDDWGGVPEFTGGRALHGRS